MILFGGRSGVTKRDKGDGGKIQKKTWTPLLDGSKRHRY